MASRSTREVWSFFSGAMGLDIGLEQAGLASTLVNEIDKNCVETIRAKLVAAQENSIDQSLSERG